MLTLFPDQQQLVAQIRRAMTRVRRTLAVAPCGFGKTVCFSHMAQRALARGKRVTILVHRTELVDQVAATLRNFDVPHGVIAAGWYGDHRLPVQVASVFTLTRRLERYAAPDLVIVDEAHHATSGTTWGRLLAEWPASYVIGVSATPVRLSGEGLGECFDEMVEGPTTADLIAAGRLSRYRLFAPQLIATADLHTRAGEYRTDELEAVSDRPSVTGDAIGHYEKQGGRGRAVAFCVSVAHAHHVAESFRAAGHEAVAVDGGMDRLERRKAVEEFKAGRVRVLTSCALVDEGFDCPGIEVAIDLSPTQSLARCLQRWGRALRTAPGKSEAVILDHAGNCGRHGMPDDSREWSLEGAKRRAKKTGQDFPVVTCPQCYRVARAGVRRCECGHVFVVVAREVETVAGELVEVTKVARTPEQIERAVMQGRARSVEQLMRIGYSRARAEHVVKARADKDALVAEVEAAIRRLRAVTGDTSWGPSEPLRKLKPKELREMLTEANAIVAGVEKAA
jgi:superfamily II DNA or RNA helicase